MKTIIAYSFTYEEINTFAEEHGFKLDFDMGRVFVSQLEEEICTEEDLINFIRVIQEYYKIEEDLLEYDLFCEDGDQVFENPVVLLPRGHY